MVHTITMNYYASRNVGSSKFGTERITSLPFLNIPIDWNGPSSLNEENFPDTVPDLHEFGSYQQPCDPLLVSLTHQEGLSQCHSLPNLTSSSSTLTKSTNIFLQSSIHYTNPQASSSTALEQYPHSGNMFALSQLHLSKAQSSSIQNLAPSLGLTYQPNEDAQIPGDMDDILPCAEQEDWQMESDQPNPQSSSIQNLAPSLGLTYQPNEDAQIPGDMDDILPCAEQEDWQMESDQPNQIILGNGNPDRYEVIGVNQDAQVTRVNVAHKTRMRWTQELHESFVYAVNDLGSANKATPKSILIKMGVSGLTISHVKSHLQKYRLQRDQPQGREDKRPSCSEGKKRNATEDSGAPKLSSKESDTLHTQWELQKALHEQLEIIRKLQLQTEENGRRLQKFIEDQNKAREAFFHATQSMPMTKGVATEGTLAPFSSDELLVSLDKDSMEDEMLFDLAKNDVSTDVELVASPSYKRARIDAESSKATISRNVFQL